MPKIKTTLTTINKTIRLYQVFHTYLSRNHNFYPWLHLPCRLMAPNMCRVHRRQSWSHQIEAESSHLCSLNHPGMSPSFSLVGKHQTGTDPPLINADVKKIKVMNLFYLPSTVAVTVFIIKFCKCIISALRTYISLVVTQSPVQSTLGIKFSMVSDWKPL